MSTIDDNCRMLTDDFDTGRPVRSAKACTQGFFIPLYTLFAQHIERCQGSGSIFELVLTCKRYGQCCISTFRCPDSKVLTFFSTLLQTIGVTDRGQLACRNLCLGGIGFSVAITY